MKESRIKMFFLIYIGHLKHGYFTQNVHVEQLLMLYNISFK